MTKTPKRTPDGHLTIESLRDGMEDQAGWKVDTDTHILKLKLFRQKPHPPLYRIEHRVLHSPVDNLTHAEVHRYLYDDLEEARGEFRRMRREPPSYDNLD